MKTQDKKKEFPICLECEGRHPKGICPDCGKRSPRCACYNCLSKDIDKLIKEKVELEYRIKNILNDKLNLKQKDLAEIIHEAIRDWDFNPFTKAFANDLAKTLTQFINKKSGA